MGRIFMESEQGIVEVEEKGNIYELTEIMKEKGRSVKLKKTHFMERDELVKSVDFNLVSDSVITNFELQFLIGNSDIVNRKDSDIELFFHKRLKVFLTEMLVEKLTNNEIKGATYSFFGNMGNEHFVSHIDKVQIFKDENKANFVFSSVLDGKINSLDVDLHKMKNEFHVDKLFNIMNNIIGEDVRTINLNCSYNTLNNRRLFNVNMLPLLIGYKTSTTQTENYLCTFTVFDINLWKEPFMIDKDLGRNI